MNQSFNKKNYFMMIKSIYMVVLLVALIVYIEDTFTMIGWQFLIFAFLFMYTIVFELITKHKKAIMLLELILSSLLIIGFNINYVFLLPIVILDVISFLKLPIYLYFLPAIFTFFLTTHQGLYLVFSTLTSIIYYQNYIILFEYQSTISLQEEKEYLLKNRMKQEVEKNQHYFENRLLLDRESLYQRLHDHLGHTINGSIYQMEASKLLIKSDPNKSQEMMGNVITALRSSMDDIRAILRKEKPTKKQLTLLQLQQLCEECKESYAIETTLLIEEGDVAESLWEVILDNSFEAVSNALKYSKCKHIEIEVRILPKFIQCWIRDDGIGCHNVIEGMGIQGMKQRVRKVNGIMNIKSEIGFEIQMIFPVNTKVK